MNSEPTIFSPRRRPEEIQRELPVTERIPRFIERLRTVEPNYIFSRCMTEINDLRKDYRLRYVRVALSRYRKAISQAFPPTLDAKGNLREHRAVKYMHSFAKEVRAYNTDGNDKVYAAHHDMQPFDPDDFIERALGQLYAPTSYSELVAALLLLTGRRPVEICFQGEFSAVDGQDDVLLFGGQAKGKGTDKPAYIIPVLTNANEILSAIAMIRRRQTFSSAADFSAKKGKEIGTGAGKVFGRDSDRNPQELRKVYAAICFDDYDRTEPQPRLTQLAYIRSILGHGPGDLKTALSYMTYYVEGDFGRAFRNFRSSMHGLEADLQTRLAAADKKAAPFIEADLARTRELSGDIIVPTESERTALEIKALTDSQRIMLIAIVNGKTTYAGLERWTVESLERRSLINVAIDETDRYAVAQLEATSRGAELATILMKSGEAMTEIVPA